MEVIGVLIAIPVSLVGSIILCAFLRSLLSDEIFVKPIAVGTALIILSNISEGVLLLISGAANVHERLGWVCDVIRIFNFFSLPPASATGAMLLQVYFKSDHRFRLPVAVCVCWFTCVSSMLLNIAIEDSIYGVDGINPPHATTTSSP